MNAVSGLHSTPDRRQQRHVSRTADIKAYQGSSSMETPCGRLLHSRGMMMMTPFKGAHTMFIFNLKVDIKKIIWL